MKAIFYIPDYSESDLIASLPGQHPALLPLLNRPLLEYMIQFAANCHVDEILIADANYDASVAEYLDDGSRWSLAISYLGMRPLRSTVDIHSYFAGFLNGTDSYLWVNGLGFFDMDYCAEMPMVGWNPMEAAPTLSMSGAFRCGQQENAFSTVPFTPVDSIRSYFECCMNLCESELSRYPLPGFHVENGIYLGMNVALPPSCEIAAPAFIGDNVSLEDRVRLEGAVCIGDEIVIDKRSTLQRTIVLSHTYLGADLELLNKIVYRDRIIDPYTGAVLVPMDAALLADIRNYGLKRKAGRMADCMVAMLLILLWAPLALIFYLFGMRADAQGFFTGISGKRCAYRKYHLNLNKLRELYFYKLCLDKYWLMFHVLKGNLALVGASLENDPVMEALGVNVPGAFCFSDTRSGHVPGVQMQLDDRYFLYNRSVHLEYGTLLRALGIRLMASSPGRGER